MDVSPRYHRHWVRWGNGAGTHACLLDLVGFDKAVLEVGCSTGYLSRVMQQRGCQVTGVEIDAAAAQMARQFCRRVVVGDAERLDWQTSLGDERFDVITFGDVLEHMRAPEAVLTRLCPFLAPGGYIVVSLPNIAHGSVRLSLLLGRFDYVPLGILDQTHLRFYTKETAQQLLASSGFQVEDVLAVNEPISSDLIGEVLSCFPQLSLDRIQDMLSREDAQAYQYIFRAVPLDRPQLVRSVGQAQAVPTLSAVISHRGSEVNLSRCLTALAADGIPLCQTIVVAESDPVWEDEPPSIVAWEWQRRQPDEGDAYALNEALNSVDGDVVLILDSGFVLQPGTLDALVHRFQADPTAGVVGARVLAVDGRTILQAGAYLSPPVAWVAYRGTGHQIDDRRWNDVAEVDFVPPVAMAFRRSLWQSLSGFDGGYCAYYIGADFCARARSAGYRVLMEPQALAISLSPVEQDFDWLVHHHRDRLRFVRQRYGEGSLPEGFFEAERSLWDKVEPGLERRAMRLAYLWQLTEGENSNCVEIKSFLDLYHRGRALESADSSLALPHLQTHRFSSPVPLLGGVIARLRALWGSIAARWYAESLVRQQNLFNQVISDRLNSLLEEISEMERLVVRLGIDLAHLRQKQHQQASRAALRREE
jgi:2-polyprenyl-3-methyl-5-hydroxy-6-metoxy-1,4-benzoquinol methylase/GT2 family glycosyltransferase